MTRLFLQIKNITLCAEPSFFSLLYFLCRNLLFLCAEYHYPFNIRKHFTCHVRPRGTRRHRPPQRRRPRHSLWACRGCWRSWVWWRHWPLTASAARGWVAWRRATWAWARGAWGPGIGQRSWSLLCKSCQSQINTWKWVRGRKLMNKMALMLIFQRLTSLGYCIKKLIRLL